MKNISASVCCPASSFLGAVHLCLKLADDVLRLSFSNVASLAHLSQNSDLCSRVLVTNIRRLVA